MNSAKLLRVWVGQNYSEKFEFPNCHWADYPGGGGPCLDVWMNGALHAKFRCLYIIEQDPGEDTAKIEDTQP